MTVSLNHGAGHIPVLGFGTLIPDAAVTISATRDGLQAGFRHFDCAERYRNEREVGEALQAGLAAGGIPREDIFATTNPYHKVLPQSCGTPIIALTPSNRLLRRVWTDSGSTIRTSISFTLPLRFNRGTSRLHGIKTAISFSDCGVPLLETWGRWTVSWTVAAAGQSDCPTSVGTDCCPSTHLRQSSQLLSRSKHIHICRKRSFWNSARRRILCFWPLRRWATE